MIYYALGSLNIVFKHNSNFKLPKNYIFFHFKKIRFDKLFWDVKKTINFINELGKISDVLFSTDIEGNYYIGSFMREFNYYDYEKDIYKNRNLKITYLHAIKELDLYNIIVKSKKTVSTHGMITNISSFFNIPTLDIFTVEHTGKLNLYSSLNASREFASFNKNYTRVVPSEDYTKTTKKILFFSRYE